MNLKVLLNGETRLIQVFGFSDEVVLYHCEFPRDKEGVVVTKRNCAMTRKGFEARMGVAL